MTAAPPTTALLWSFTHVQPAPTASRALPKTEKTEERREDTLVSEAAAATADVEASDMVREARLAMSWTVR